MTTEELKKEAEESAKKFFGKPTDLVDLDNLRIFKIAYLASAKSREKRIAELEEANNELKGKLVLNDMVLKDDTKRIKELEDKLMDKVCLESLDIVSGKIKQLEKENAELKEYNKYLKRKRQGGIQKQYNKVAIIKQQNEQLTKAKEIIKKLIEAIHIWDCKNLEKVEAEAEQFLKGCK